MLYGRLDRYGVEHLVELASLIDADTKERARRYVQATVCDGPVGIRSVAVRPYAPPFAERETTLVHIVYVIDRFTAETSVDVDTFNRMTRA